CVVATSRTCLSALFLFFFQHPSTTQIYTLSLHDALPISSARDIGRLGGPRRDGAQTRHAEQHAALGRRRGLAVLEQALQYIGFERIERSVDFDEMPVLGGGGPDRLLDRCEAGVEFVATERGSGAAAA